MALAVPVGAEQITLQTRGGGCNHVAVLGERGNQIGIYMRDEIMEPIKETDDRLMIQIKTLVAESQSRDFDAAKSYIETKEMATDEEVKGREATDTTTDEVTVQP